MGLSTTGQKQFHQFRTQLMELYGTQNLGEQFAVEPSIQQKLELAITDSNAFLSMITTLGVEQMSGQKISMDFSGFVGKRTDTKAGHDRKTIDPHGMDESEFRVNESEYDVMLEWLVIDTWAKFRDFYKKWQAGVTKQIGANRIQVGFHGQYSAKETSNAGYSATDATMHTMGQDFHMGWLAYAIHWAGPDRVMGLNDDGTVKPIKVGPGGDFANMESLVFDLCFEKLPEQHREDAAHRALVGASLFHQEMARVIDANGDEAAQKKALEAYLKKYELSTKRVLKVPHFPQGGLVVTPPENFAHYHQTGSHYRSIKNNDDRKSIEDKNRMNEDFVVTNLDNFAMIHPDAIKVKGKVGTPDEDKWVQASKTTWAIEVPEGMEG